MVSSCGLAGTLHVDGGDGGHEAALKQAVGVGGLVVTVQLGPHKMLPEALGPWRGAGPRSLWTCGAEDTHKRLLDTVAGRTFRRTSPCQSWRSTAAATMAPPPAISS